MKLLVLLFALLSQSIASANTCCICETGVYPSSQVGFFQMGCSIWLAKQKKCNVKATVSDSRDVYDQAKSCRGGLIKLGYVGHWSGSYETINYLERWVTPLLKDLKASVVYNNTACNPTENPDRIQSYMKNQRLKSPQFLRVEGSQVVSIGMWERITPLSVSIPAAVDSRSSQIEYPSCKSVADRPCTQALQLHQRARCYTASRQVAEVQCREEKVTYMGGEIYDTRTEYLWKLVQ